MIRVGVVGASGKMGREVCRAVDDDPELELVAAVSRSAAGAPLSELLALEGSTVVAAAELAALVDAGAEVLVDFTGPTWAPEHVAWGIDHGIHVVEGSTGFEIDPAWVRSGSRVRLPRAQLRDRRRFDDAVRDGSREASPRRGDRSPPSSQARHAERHGPHDRAPDRGCSGRRAGDVPIHSVRLPGIVANQEVIFGGPGQTLSIRHDTTDRTAFMPGVLLAIKAVVQRPPGLIVGLDALMGP